MRTCTYSFKHRWQMNTRSLLHQKMSADNFVAELALAISAAMHAFVARLGLPYQPASIPGVHGVALSLAVPREIESKCGFTTCPSSGDKSTSTATLLHMLGCSHRPINDVERCRNILQHIQNFKRQPITGNTSCCYCGKAFSEEQRSSKKRCSIARHKFKCSQKILLSLQTASADTTAQRLDAVWKHIVKTAGTEHGRPKLVLDPRQKAPRSIRQTTITHFQSTQVRQKSRSRTPDHWIPIEKNENEDGYGDSSAFDWRAASNSPFTLLRSFANSPFSIDAFQSLTNSPFPFDPLFTSQK